MPPRSRLPAMRRDLRGYRGLAVPILAILVAAVPSSGHGQTTAAPLRLSLEEAVERALVTAPDAVASETAIALAEADRLEAKGSWLPSFTLGTGYTNSSNERVDSSTGRIVSESYTAQATANLLLFQGGRRVFESQATSALVAAAQAEHRGQIYETILAVTSAFYEAAAASDLEALARQRLERARQQLSFARTRVELGTATASDVLRAELEMGNAELAVLDAGSALRTAALELGRLVGVADDVLPLPESLPDSAPPLPPVEALVRRAEERSPLVMAASAELRGSRATRNAAFSSYLPTIGLTGGYDWFSPEFPPDRRTWNVRLTATLPVFDRFGREAEGQRARALLRRAEAVARDAALGARALVESAVQEIQAAEQRVQIANRARELAEEDLRVLEERYRSQVATILDLQTSQVALAQAESDAVRARQSLGTALARLEAVLGETIEEANRD